MPDRVEEYLISNGLNPSELLTDEGADVLAWEAASLCRQHIGTLDGVDIVTPLTEQTSVSLGNIRGDGHVPRTAFKHTTQFFEAVRYDGNTVAHRIRVTIEPLAPEDTEGPVVSEAPGYGKPAHQYGQSILGQCPDGGTCHHDCSGPQTCFRVGHCGPLSDVFPDNQWPAGVVNAHLPTDGHL